jgi:glycerol-3-phosphate dehydrogenase (NAD(P)+)
MPKIAVVGATTWGSTLGYVWARKGHDVAILARTAEESVQLEENRLYNLPLPRGRYPAKMSFTASIPEAIQNAQAVILVVPSQTMRRNIKLIAPFINETMLIISACKGLEVGTSKRMTEVIEAEIPHASHRNICVLSGPNLAREILLGHPAATVVAAEDKDVAKTAQKLLNSAR